MSDDAGAVRKGGLSRRGFLQRAAFVGAALSAAGLLSKARFGGLGREGRTTPADLPGAGSIFQPRNDTRVQR